MLSVLGCGGKTTTPQQDEDECVRLAWYPDADLDGYTSLDGAVLSCEPLGGYTDTPSAQDDCDDDDSAVHPGAVERCDGIDNDCSGLADDDAFDAQSFYVDADGDGFAEEADPIALCADDAGEHLPAPQETFDCDDTDPHTFPGAEERCGDGVINDCVSTATEASAVCLGGEMEAVAALTVTSEADRDLLGLHVSGAGDVDGDGRGDMLIGGDMYDQGRVHVFSGAARGQLGVDDAPTTITPPAGSQGVMLSPAGPGDLNGDGYDDVAIVSQGEVYLFSAEGGGDLDAADAHTIVSGGSAARVHRAGDVTGDGYDDMLVGGSRALDVSSVWLLAGNISGSASLDAAHTRWDAEETEAFIGWAHDSAGDIDGDGIGDVVVGRGWFDVPTAEPDRAIADAGAAHLMLGGSPGTFQLEDTAVISVWGQEEGEQLGQAVRRLGDFDGDGRDDVLVQRGTTLWSAFVVLGGFLEHDTRSAEDAFLYIEDDGEPGTMVGALCGAGDMNGDGLADLAVQSGSYAETVVYVALGGLSGTVSLAELPIRYTRDGGYTSGGRMLSSAGDTDGDGLDDLLVGLPSANLLAGEARLLPGARY